MEKYRQDPTYDWNIVYFAVEDHLFKVPDYHFVAGSDFFAAKYRLNSETRHQGHDNDHPITLKGITVDEFRVFLRYFYPVSADFAEPTTPQYPKEWIAILKLATQWRFCATRKVAIDRLKDLFTDPVERILAARQYFVLEWLQSGYRELICRESQISETEATKIGLVQAIRVFTLREKYLMHDIDPVDEAMESSFGEEFNNLGKLQDDLKTKEEKQLWLVRMGPKKKEQLGQDEKQALRVRLEAEMERLERRKKKWVVKIGEIDGRMREIRNSQGSQSKKRTANSWNEWGL